VSATVPSAAPAPASTPAASPLPARVARLDRLAIALIAGATLFHVIYAGLLALSPQEAYYWEWSRRLDLSYFDHPPLASWTIAAFTSLLGQTERAVRLAAALHSTVFALFFWASARRLFGSRAALVALGAGLLTPLFALAQVIITPDGPLLSGWAMALYFTIRALDDDEPRWLLAAGAATGWALLGKYTAALLLPQILLVLVLHPRGRRMLRTPWPWLGAALALVLFSPVVLWNLRHALASFEFQTGERVANSRLRPELVGRFLGLQAAIVTPIVLVLLFEAAVASVRRWRDPRYLVCAAFAAPLLAIAVVVSPVHWVKANWLAPAYPAALVAGAALALDGARWRRRAGVAGLALAAVGAIYVHLVPLFPWVPFPARDEGSSGWRELAARVQAERAALGPDAFVAGCNYKVSAELAFYLPDQPRTWSNELAGDIGLQYRYWFRPEELAGRTGLVIRDRREKQYCKRLAEACAPLEPLAPLTPLRGAQPVTTFELYRCRWTGPPPAR
jgi:4-amino-4-deoxy-L-arabinose transferase-like glycosyltransferase